MKKMCRRFTTLLLGACIAAPLTGSSEPASAEDKSSKPDMSQEQKAPTLKDRRVREKAPMPNANTIPPGTDMPIIIQDQPVNMGVVKLI